jgi:acetyl esterase/lipase
MFHKTTHTYKTVGANALEADVYRPDGQDAQPAILWIHGGALIMGSRESLPAEGLFGRLMNAGYALISVDYRLAPEAQLAEIVADIEDAYAWALGSAEILKIDKARVAIMGMSAGGYLTLTAGFRVEPKPKALVSFYGYGDITGPWYREPSSFYRTEYPLVSRDEAYRGVEGGESAGGSRGRPDFYLYCRQNGLWPQLVAGHDPETDAAWFRGYEPLRNVTPDYPPTLLLHGEQDTDVPYEQSLLMADALRRRGVEHALISNPAWGHGFDLSPEDAPIGDVFDRVERFLAAHL